MLKNEKKQISKRNKKAAQFLILIGIVILPVFILTGCRSFTCTWCGSSNTYTPFCASGTKDGVEYSSCIGPAACFNCGLGTCIWPTECLSVKFARGYGGNADGEIVTGYVYYYDPCGCISGEDSMSSGSYSRVLNCGASGGCGTCGTCGLCGSCADYKEDVYSDRTLAYSGCGLCGAAETESYDYNNSLPRQYPRGCCSVCDDEEE